MHQPTLHDPHAAAAACATAWDAAEAVFALSLAAASLLENPPGMDSSRVGIARFVASSWCSFNEACFLFNPNKSAPAALLLTTPLLQLMAALPQHIKNVKQGPDSFMKLMGSAVATFDVALDSPSHPGLRHWLPNSSSSLSPQQLEVCDINIRAALQQQVRQATNTWSLVLHVPTCAQATRAWCKHAFTGKLPPSTSMRHALF
jgi:hypothetical protein